MYNQSYMKFFWNVNKDFIFVIITHLEFRNFKKLELSKAFFFLFLSWYYKRNFESTNVRILRAMPWGLTVVQFN